LKAFPHRKNLATSLDCLDDSIDHSNPALAAAFHDEVVELHRCVALQHLLLSHFLLALLAPKQHHIKHLLAIDEDWVAEASIDGVGEAVHDMERLLLGLLKEEGVSIEDLFGIIGRRRGVELPVMFLSSSALSLS
jgi:hypothetical protein